VQLSVVGLEMIADVVLLQDNLERMHIDAESNKCGCIRSLNRLRNAVIEAVFGKQIFLFPKHGYQHRAESQRFERKLKLHFEEFLKLICSLKYQFTRIGWLVHCSYCHRDLK